MNARRLAFFAGAGLALLLVLWICVAIFTNGGLGLLDDGVEVPEAYFIEFALIFGDAIIPVLPGETTLNTAAVLASDGVLELPLVILAGSLGAVLGDSALYWIARRAGERYGPQVERAKEDSRVKFALEILGDRYAMLIVFGRYVPGLRFVVNATMGVTKLPYRHFVVWSTIGGVTWATYTALLAYYVGSALEDYPLGSVIVSGTITTLLIAALFFLERGKLEKRRAERRAASD